MKEKLKAIVSVLEGLKEVGEEEVKRVARERVRVALDGPAADLVNARIEEKAPLIALGARLLGEKIETMVRSVRAYADGERREPPVVPMSAILVAIEAASAAAACDPVATAYFTGLKAKLADLGILDVAKEMGRL